MRQQRRSHPDGHGGDDSVGGELAAVKERLESLTRHLERMARANADPNVVAQADERAEHLSNAMARLDRRLNEVVAEDRDSTHEFYRRGQYAPHPSQFTSPPAANPAPSSSPRPSPLPANWTAQIAARQRALDAAHAAAATPPEGMSRQAIPDPSYWEAQIAARQRTQADARAPTAFAYGTTPAYAAIPAYEAPSTYSTSASAAKAPAAAPAYRSSPYAGSAATPGDSALGHAAVPPVSLASPPPNWSSHFSALQQQLQQLNAQISSLHQPYESSVSTLQQEIHQLNTRISSLHQPYENSLGALRSDLAHIGQTLTHAMPNRAIEALEGEVRALGERVEHMRHNSAHDAALGAMRQELAEIRNALPRFDVAEGFGHVGAALRDLHDKVDHVAALSQTPQIDPMAFTHLEKAVVALRGSNLASDVALGQIAAEVRALGANFERLSAESGAAAFGRLEARIASLIEAGLSARPEVDGSIRELGDRLERMQLSHSELSHSDQLALGALEDRIARLSEKLDASDSRLGHLEAVERGLADLLVHLEEMRNSGGRTLRASPTQPAPAPAAVASAVPPPAAPTAVTTQTPHTPSALDLLLPETPLPGPMHPPVAQPSPPPPRSPQQLQPLARRAAPIAAEPIVQPEPARPPAARTMPRGPQRPIDPNLPPDTPLEPGSGAPRMKPGSAAARIAASEAALGNSRLAAMETGGKSAAIAAARNAARAAHLDNSMKADGKARKWLSWPFKKAAKELLPNPPPHTAAPPPQLPPIPAATPPAAALESVVTSPAAVNDATDAAPSSRAKAVKILKTILIAASVAIIIAGVAQVGMEYLFPDQPRPITPFPPKDQSQSLIAPKSQTSLAAPNWPTLTPAPAPATAPAAGSEEPQQTTSAADPDVTNSVGRNSSVFDTNTAVKIPEVTGSIPSSRAPLVSHAPGEQSNRDPLPASISVALRTAVEANDPAAQYELGVRYADGRGAQQSLSDAIRWFELAANAGFAPAQFRLGSLNEKGEGVRKDVKAAQRLYLAAAAQGHAKAMHNLAVLYAEGIDGKPDYKAASEWFRKAAGYGVTDSQYNLAILFARGIGVQVSLVDSYKWFALAAANGDSDAAKKRDEVASRLDPTALSTAKLAVQAFSPERQPDEATNLRTPPGGWDHATASPAKPRRRS